MIQSFTVTNPNGRSMVCELANPYKEGLAVSSIEGLGPGQATINVADISSMDGGLFNSARKSTRNIVFNFVFVDHDTLTIEDIRRKCYAYFPLKKNVKLKFTTGNGILNKDFLIEGYVESNEPAIFSSLEGATVSIICPNPYFYKASQQEEMFHDSATPEFYFAFSKDPVEEADTKLLMGNIVNYVTTNIVYDGDADTGVVFEIVFKTDVDYNIEDQEITVQNALTNTQTKFSLEKITDLVSEYEGMEDYEGIVAGDKIILSTVKGSKYLTYIHDGVEYNVLSAITSSGQWVYITGGINTIAIKKDDPDLEILASSKNKIYFYGV